MARQKKEAPPPAGAPAWMATFTDMMTLVLVFFVLLYSMSTVDVAKWKALVQNLNGSPDIFEKYNLSQSNPGTTGLEILPEFDIDPEEYMDNVDDWEAVIAAVMNHLGEWRKGEGEGPGGGDGKGAGDITISATDMEIIINIPGDVLFRSADDTVLETAKPLITGVMDNLVLPELRRGTISSVRIEGHTDRRQLPPGHPRFRDNWQLSQARSLSVFRFIMGQYPELEPYIREGSFGNMGYGEFRPLDDALGDTEEEYARNRRVSFVMTKNPNIEDIMNALSENDDKK